MGFAEACPADQRRMKAQHAYRRSGRRGGRRASGAPGSCLPSCPRGESLRPGTGRPCPCGAPTAASCGCSRRLRRAAACRSPLDANTIGRSRRCPRCCPGLAASAPPAFIYASAEIRSAAVEGPDRGDAPGVTVAGWVVGVSGSVAAGALASALLTPSTSSRSENVKKSVFADVHHWWAGGVIMRTSSR